MSAATRPPATLTNNKDGARATTTTTTTGSGNSKQRQPNTTDGRCTQVCANDCMLVVGQTDGGWHECRRCLAA